jgi:hypothetical protein
VLTNDICYLKSCASPIVVDEMATLGVITGTRPLAPAPAAYCATPALEQVAVAVEPTQTVVTLRDSARSFELTLSFVSSMLADDYERLSRPVYRVELSLLPLKSVGEALVYLDMSAQHVVNEKLAEPVEWSKFEAGASVSGVRIGTSAQCVLCDKGDKTNINWGYLYLAPVGGGSSRGGSAEAQRTSFAKTGALPATPDMKMPRSSTEDMPAVSAVVRMTPPATAAQGSQLTASFVVAYDDVASVMYYGTPFKGFWTQKWSSIEEAIEASVSPAEIAAVSAATAAQNTKLIAELTEVLALDVKVI